MKYTVPSQPSSSTQRYGHALADVSPPACVNATDVMTKLRRILSARELLCQGAGLYAQCKDSHDCAEQDAVQLGEHHLLVCLLACSEMLDRCVERMQRPHEEGRERKGEREDEHEDPGAARIDEDPAVMLSVLAPGLRRLRLCTHMTMPIE